MVVLPPSSDCLDRERANSTVLTEVFLYYCILFDVLVLLSVLLVNCLVITAIVKYRRYHTGTVRTYNSGASMKFVVNLAVSDLLTGAGVFILALTRYWCGFNELFCGNRYLCLMKFVPSFFGQVSSGLNLIAIAIDRYIAVFRSFRYRTIMTDRTCHITILVLWVVAFIITHSLYFWNMWGPQKECTLENVTPLSFILFVDSFFHLIVLVLVGGIHYKLHRKACESSSQQILFRDAKTNIKSLKLVILVIGVYFFCWLPLSLLHIIGAVTRREESVYFYYAIRIVQPLRNMYIVINPFIYAWKNLEVRDSIKWFFKKQR
ncbi:UNVERIFIED_CONTAM: hypothetical protein PYX00_003582 [Menopon gallinae]|uniref:G-protein coupled receptors family 1 profile domain-containing protein n=1 Tax=Menopon gallinae TaxID=328185 RepID=A0AAW2I0H7_9NEOP